MDKKEKATITLKVHVMQLASDGILHEAMSPCYKRDNFLGENVVGFRSKNKT